VTVRRIVEAGNPKLKAKNKFVKNVRSLQVQKLIKDLSDTMYKTDLIGIAAPQIGENYLVFVTHPRNTGARKLVRADTLRVFINPKITFQSKAKSLIYEGCGSLDNGGIFGPVLRPKEVQVEAFDQNGQRFSLRADGILARVIQHEYDHLQQTEFIQKVSDYNKVVVQKYYRKYIRRSKPQIANSKTSKIEFKTL
jgi:peptide deformylase